jgi:hypothetical protein
MVDFFGDLNDKNMSLSVLKDGLGTRVQPLHNFIKNNSIGLVMFVQIAPYFDHKYNKVCYI